MQFCAAESCSCTDGVTLVQEKETLKRALVLWNRAASQGVCVCMCTCSYDYRIANATSLIAVKGIYMYLES